MSRTLFCDSAGLNAVVDGDRRARVDELLAGAGAAAIAALVAELASYQAATRFRMRIKWLVPALRLPGRVVRDMVIVYADDGTRPAFSIVAPDFQVYSEENPQDVRKGESFAAEVINRVLHGKGWPYTLLIKPPSLPEPSLPWGTW